MGKAKTKTVDSRKPKHSNDSSRPSKTPVGKGGKEHRDASTVRFTAAGKYVQVKLRTDCSRRMLSGAQAQHVQDSCHQRQKGEDHTRGESFCISGLGQPLGPALCAVAYSTDR